MSPLVSSFSANDRKFSSLSTRVAHWALSEFPSSLLSFSLVFTLSLFSLLLSLLLSPLRHLPDFLSLYPLPCRSSLESISIFSSRQKPESLSRLGSPLGIIEQHWAVKPFLSLSLSLSLAETLSSLSPFLFCYACSNHSFIFSSSLSPIT